MLSPEERKQIENVIESREYQIRRTRERLESWRAVNEREGTIVGDSFEEDSYNGIDHLQAEIETLKRKLAGA